MTEPVARYSVEANSDGTAIVKLARPVTWKGEALSRLTIPRITGKHMRHATWEYGSQISVGQLVDFAARVVEPLGVVDELDADIARDIGMEVVLHLGKASRVAGGAPSAP